MTFSSGDQVTVVHPAISVSGSLTANGTDFINGGANSNITFTLDRDPQWRHQHLQPADLSFPTRCVASLAGNTSFDQVYIEAGTISSGTLALNLIGTTPNMSYMFASGFTVAAGGTMTVGANVPVGGSRVDAERRRER